MGKFMFVGVHYEFTGIQRRKEKCSHQNSTTFELYSTFDLKFYFYVKRYLIQMFKVQT